MKKDSKKQKAARKRLEAEEQRRIFNLGYELGLRVAKQQPKSGVNILRY